MDLLSLNPCQLMTQIKKTILQSIWRTYRCFFYKHNVYKHILRLGFTKKRWPYGKHIVSPKFVISLNKDKKIRNMYKKIKNTPSII